MRRRRLLVSILIMGLLTLVAGIALAQGAGPPEREVRAQSETAAAAIAPGEIPIQGRLTDDAGNPLDGTYNITFRLYEQSSGGTPLCSDTNSVDVENGLFSDTMEGCHDDLYGQKVWLGVEVGSDGEMTDRQVIYPVPYALGLRPGAVISDTSSNSILTVHNDGTGSALTLSAVGWGVLGGGDGVHVISAAGDGVHVGSATRAGVYVGSVGGNGVQVNSATYDGVSVFSAGGYAGNFNGDVSVSGNLSKGGGGFKIDHPLDPENRYLYHSFVESPDMMNIYNGNVTTDEDGYATVTLPDYFGALNEDYRYQLTVIGTFAQAIIAQEIEDGQFAIQTDEPNVKVSWQVMGIRKDPWAEANRIPVEEEKPVEERGVYVHPEAYGLPETMGLAYREAQAQEADRPAAGR